MVLLIVTPGCSEFLLCSGTTELFCQIGLGGPGGREISFTRGNASWPRFGDAMSVSVLNSASKNSLLFSSVTWDGKNANGGLVSSGLYFYRLTAGSFGETKKMVLVK